MKPDFLNNLKNDFYTPVGKIELASINSNSNKSFNSGIGKPPRNNLSA
jgi:hypothetical protein